MRFTTAVPMIFDIALLYLSMLICYPPPYLLPVLPLLLLICVKILAIVRPTQPVVNGLNFPISTSFVMITTLGFAVFIATTVAVWYLVCISQQSIYLLGSFSVVVYIISALYITIIGYVLTILYTRLFHMMTTRFSCEKLNIGHYYIVSLLY